MSLYPRQVGIFNNHVCFSEFERKFDEIFFFAVGSYGRAKFFPILFIISFELPKINFHFEASAESLQRIFLRTSLLEGFTFEFNDS